MSEHTDVRAQETVEIIVELPEKEFQTLRQLSELSGRTIEQEAVQALEQAIAALEAEVQA